MEFSFHYQKKLRTLLVTIGCALSIIVGRLIYLQIIQQHNFFSLSVKNFLRTEPIPSLRGSIFDCNGNLLATNRPLTALYWQGTGNASFLPEQNLLLQTIQEICGPINERALLKAEQKGCKIEIYPDVSFTQLSKLLELFPNSANIVVSTHFKRYYPNQNLACHILGHLSSCNSFEAMGKMGLEKILHDSLQGKHGRILKTINSLGKSIKQEEINTALPGQDIVTTLDLSLQRIAESAFPAEYNGALLLMDPKTGALRAVISKPDFDPTLFLDPIASEQWNLLQQGNPFLNRAFNACYPPASIFKLVTISAALEANILSRNDKSITCNGFYYFKKRKHYCDRRSGHGELSIKEAVAKSCNILFYEIGRQLPIDTLADYAHRFGLGKKTNVIFPEKEGFIPTTQWKHECKGEPWWPGETLSCAIGQSYCLATPIQVACMVSSIFEGYIVTPRILEQEAITLHPLAINFSTRKFLRKSMKSAVRVGTGKDVSKIEDITVFAKTGTAQVVELSFKKDASTPKAHTWFVAYFTYKNQPPLTLVIFLEHTGNSKPGRICAKNFLMKYRSYMKHKEQEQLSQNIH